MTTTSAPARPGGHSALPPTGLSRLWHRQLNHYPETGPRSVYLGITVLATVILYYEFYVQGAVATQIIRDFGFSFRAFVFVQVIGAAVGACASVFAGLADRWGRANLVVGGLLITGLIILVGLPNVTSGTGYAVLFALLSVVEGIVLVATPALIRDFSPQVGRATAMGFWALGPVLGSLLVTEVSSFTLDDHPDWRFQFHVCGIAGLVVFVITLIGLRELSPALRDQLMVNMRDRALIEARAAGLDTEKALKGHWRQMLRLDVVGSAFAISTYLLLYYTLVGFTVVYFATVYGYSEARANALANWYWIANALTLVVIGLLSDRLRVRKPFMIVGTVIGLVGAALFALSATEHQSYYTLAGYFVLSSCGAAMTYAPWMASFTETVEKHNPAATATGLAIYAWTVRIVVTVALAVFTLAVPATSTLVDKAPPIQAMQAEDPLSFSILTGLDPATAKALAARPTPEPAVLAKALSTVAVIEGASQGEARGVAETVTSGQAAAQAVDPATLAALKADPADRTAGSKAAQQIQQSLGVSRSQALRLLTDLGDPSVQASLTAAQKYGADLRKSSTAFTPEQLATLRADGKAVARAAQESPGQWQTWWWVCAAGQLVFLPFVFLMAGRWSPRRAREDEQAHEEMVRRELDSLRQPEGV
ncbi:MFS transporter [Streptomyces sp. VNUA24]|uniref:MFS transporter n=1 Tax=Streptomyces sp. VNUA24 TaxID=3031131 RepID=UPI0023B80BC3|nr:MFS transporter [Streptomyces sp. VNUA24]WEH13090.1 MFS transporter [Streptomyces sp. VNUA24]